MNITAEEYDTILKTQIKKLEKYDKKDIKLYNNDEEFINIIQNQLTDLRENISLNEKKYKFNDNQYNWLSINNKNWENSPEKITDKMKKNITPNSDCCLSIDVFRKNEFSSFYKVAQHCRNRYMINDNDMRYEDKSSYLNSSKKLRFSSIIQNGEIFLHIKEILTYHYSGWDKIEEKKEDIWKLYSPDNGETVFKLLFVSECNGNDLILYCESSNCYLVFWTNGS